MAHHERVLHEFYVRDSGVVNTARYDDAGKLLDTGYVMEGHEHAFFHLTVIAMGVWRVNRSHRIVDAYGVHLKDGDGKLMYHALPPQIAKPGSFFGIEAQLRHRFELLEGPGMYLCIYTHKDPDSGAQVMEYNGWGDAYGGSPF